MNSSSKNLNESDIITFLNKYLVDFEDNLRGHNFKMNTLLIETIIDKFGKIFQLWDENIVLQNSVDKKPFENIHKSMQYSFSANDDRHSEPVTDYSNDFTLECNHCGEAFPLRNKDCQYSYELHEISEEHTEFLKNLNDKDSFASSSSHTDSDNEIEVDPTVSPYEQLFIYARCNLCYDRITFGEMNYKDEAMVTKCILTHLEEPSHRRNVNVFRENKQYVEEVALKRNIFKCKICDHNSYFDKLIQHFESLEHKTKVLGNVDGMSNSRDGCFSEDQVELRFQPVWRPLRMVNVESKNVNEGLSSERNNGLSISEFDTSCFIFKNDSLQCKICPAKIAHESLLIPHVKGKKHLKMTKLYESYGNFSKEIDDKIRCIVCECDLKKYRLFFDHCKSKTHQEKVNQLKIQP